MFWSSNLSLSDECFVLDLLRLDRVLPLEVLGLGRLIAGEDLQLESIGR